MKFTVLLSAALVSAVLSAQASTQGAAAQTNANPETAMTALFGDPAIVKAKGFQIKQSDLESVVSAAKANAAAAGQQMPSDFDASVLNQLITIQTLLQTANDADRAAGKLSADEQYTNLLKKFSTPEAFDRQLKAFGMTVAELRAKATQEATAYAALKRQLNISITEQEAKDFYNQHPSEFEQPEMVHVRHILLMTIDPTSRPPVPLSTNAIAQKRKQIEDLRKRVLAGEDFATLAKQYSEDPGTKNDGGELPLFRHGEMVAEFEAAAFALNTNQVSEVVTTQYGYHIIKLLDKTPAKKIDFATAMPGIKDYLSQQKIAKVAPDFIKKLRVDQEVQIVDPALKAAEDQFEASRAAAAAAAAAEATGTGTLK